MAQSLNGYIAKDNGDTSWVGSDDLKHFEEVTTNAGNVVMGRNTYEMLQSNGEFPLKNRLNVVMTSENFIVPENDNVVFTTMSPGEVVDFLREKNYDQAMVIGGGRIAKSFFEAGLIHEVYVTIEPVIFGRGVSFIESDNFVEGEDLEVGLELLETVQLSDNEIQLHYRVKNESVFTSDEGNESEDVAVYND